MQHPYAPVSFAGGTLGAQRHMCAFFYSRDEEYRVLLPFIKEGFERGEKAYHIGDPALREDHFRRLTEAGIDVKGALARGQFEFKPWEEAHLRPGYFDQDQTISAVDEWLESAKQQGYPLSRVISRQEWALQDRPGVDDVVEYETRVNATLSLRPDPVICIYDPTKFGGGIMMDIMRTHPTVIIGGRLRENPFYLPAEEFLRELHARGAARRAAPPAV